MRTPNPLGASTLAIKDATVIPMDSERLLPKHTMIVREGLIDAVGPSNSTSIPAGAEVIDGQGMYLIPGLANMHAHLMEFDPDPAHLALYLAGGVCTVRSLNSPPEIYKWREKARGEWIAPTILMSGPAIVGFPPDYRLLGIGLRLVAVVGLTAFGVLALGAASLGMLIVEGEGAAAEFARRFAAPWMLVSLLISSFAVGLKLVPLRALAARVFPVAAIVESPGQAGTEVRRQAREGVDCIKPYDHLDRETYLAALRIAKKVGLYSVGHIPDHPEIVTSREAFEAGLDEVAHVDEFTHEFLVDYDPGASGWVEWEVDASRVNKIASLAAEHAISVSATLVTNETVLLGLEEMETLLKRPEYEHLRPATISSWRSSGRMVKWRGQESYRRTRLRPMWMQLTSALHRAGVPILLGTDSSVEGIVPGFSEHREMELLVEAGMTPYEALAAGTRNAARIAERMGAESNWGTIEVGNRADLVLLTDNPLADIRNSKHIEGVMVRGQWLTSEDLGRLVSEYRGTQG